MTDRRNRGTCFGYAVESDLAFRFLRAGDGDPLDVFVGANHGAKRGELLREWSSEDPPGHEIRLYGDGGLYRLQSTFLGSFTIDPSAPSIQVPDTGQHLGREQMTLVTAMLLCFHARGDLPLHAASIDIGGEAIVVTAPGTFGKTTLSAGFWKSGHRLLSEDLTCVRREPIPAILPGPAMIRLRRDVAGAIQLPDVERVVETPSRLCLALDPERRGNSDPVPLRAIVLIMPEEGDFRLDRAETPEAVRDLWTMSGLFPTEEDFARRFEAVTELVSAVPVYNLVRRRRLNELEDTVLQIVANV